MRGCVVVIALLIVRGGLAYAGDCSTGEPPRVAAVEAYARKPGVQAPALDSLCMEQGLFRRSRWRSGGSRPAT
jgi:hypothetical protein